MPRPHSLLITKYDCCHLRYACGLRRVGQVHRVRWHLPVCALERRQVVSQHFAQVDVLGFVCEVSGPPRIDANYRQVTVTTCVLRKTPPFQSGQWIS